MNIGHDTLSSLTLIDGRYRVIRPLGEGATGGVILVADTGLDDRLLALKILLPHLLSNETSITRFRSETRITMSLSHPNIVQTFGMGRHENSYYYLKMEYCEGRSVRSIIEQNPNGVPVEQAIIILRDIASALEYAHSRGVIHRDLKPENIIVTDGPQARLLDFGLAQSFQSDTRVTTVGSVLGTPYYMSPEQLRSELLDARSDTYAFGIVAYELLEGNRPFQGNSLFELADAQLNEELPDIKNTEVPLWLVEMINHCTKKNRLQRPDSISEVRQQLERHAVRKTPLTPQADTSRNSGSTVLETQSQSRHRVMQRLASGTRILILGVLPLVFFAAPYLNESVRWRYLVVTAMAEKYIGRELPPLRLVSNAPPDFEFPAGAFGPSEARRQELMEGGYLLTKELDDRKYYRPFLMAGHSPNVLDPIRGTYPLHYYVQKQKSGVVEDFLVYGADPNLFDSFGHTALDYATGENLGQVRTLSTLLKHGADPGIYREGDDPPLVKAIKKSRLRSIRTMLRSPLVDPNIKDGEGNPAIFAAIANGDAEVVKLIIQAGAVTTYKDTTGRNVLQFMNSLTYLPERNEIEKLLRTSMELQANSRAGVTQAMHSRTLERETQRGRNSKNK